MDNKIIRSSSKFTIGISDLPREILDEIFHLLDGKTQVICKRVCKTWRSSIKYLEKKNNYWFEHCQNEISIGVQFDILDNVFPYHWKNQSCVDWQIVYKIWYTWNCLPNDFLLVEPKRIASKLNGISCIKLSGKYLLISTCEGRGKLTALNLCGSGSVDVYEGGNSILNIQLVNSDRPHLPCVRAPRELKEIFNAIEHNEIWLELKMSYIQLGENYCRTIDKLQQKISHSHGYEVKLVDADNLSSVLYLNKTCANVKGPEVMELELPVMYSQISNCWLNKISLIPFAAPGDHMFRLNTITVNMKTQIVFLNESIEFLKSLGEIVTVFTWQGELSIIHSDKRRIVFQHKGNKITQATSFRKACVTSVLFYANHLFLGTDRGQLLVFKVKSPADCLSIVVFETEPSWFVQLEELVKIIHIAVVEPPHYNANAPAVICSSPEDVFLIPFQVKQK